LELIPELLKSLQIRAQVKVVVLACKPIKPGGPVRQPYARVNFITPVRNDEFGEFGWLQVYLAEKSCQKSATLFYT
jgi:hypothetical protein